MANRGFVKCRKVITVDSVNEILEEINKNTFKNKLNIVNENNFWDVSYKNSKFNFRRSFWLETKRTFEISHGGSGLDVAWWFDFYLSNQIALKFNGKITDEGVSDVILPRANFPNLKKYIEDSGHIKVNGKKQKNGFWIGNNRFCFNDYGELNEYIFNHGYVKTNINLNFEEIENTIAELNNRLFNNNFHLSFKDNRFILNTDVGDIVFWLNNKNNFETFHSHLNVKLHWIDDVILNEFAFKYDGSIVNSDKNKLTGIKKIFDNPCDYIYNKYFHKDVKEEDWNLLFAGPFSGFSNEINQQNLYHQLKAKNEK